MTSLKIWLGKKFLRLKSKLKLNINIERLNMLKKFSFFRIWSTVFWFNHTNIWKELIRVDAPMNYATLLLQTFIQIVRPKLFLCVKFFFPVLKRKHYNNFPFFPFTGRYMFYERISSIFSGSVTSQSGSNRRKWRRHFAKYF